MPRIAAALAVLLTVVTCIGFNTARYPMVWEMVASSGHFPRLHPWEESAAGPQSIAASVSASAPQPASVVQSQAAFESAAVAPGSQDPPDETVREPTTVEPISVYRAEAGGRLSPGWTEDAAIIATDCEPSDCPRTSAAWEGLLVGPSADWEDPVAPCATEPVEAPAWGRYASSPCETSAFPVGHTEKEAEAEPTDAPNRQATLVPVKPPGAEHVRRLPPVDKVWVDPGADNRPPRADDTIPIYATTGIH